MSYQVKIEKIIHKGYGLAKLNNKVIFVHNVLPEEEVAIKIIDSTKNYDFAIPEQILKISPERIDASCPYYLLCGGCQLMHTHYENQIKIKTEIVKEFATEIHPQEICEFVQSPDPYHYKSAVQFIMKNNSIGFYQRHSHNLIPVNYCYIVDEQINQFIKTLKMDQRFEQLVIKIDNHKNVSSNLFHQKKKHLKYVIEDLVLQYDYRTFFQSNQFLIPSWLELIKKEISQFNLKRVLDLYSGVGIITLYLAHQLPIKKITGIELDNTASNFAKMNRDVNKIMNANFQSGDAIRVLKNYDYTSALIMNPPRGGAGKEVIKEIARLRPEGIIISSCEISNFIRDAQDLIEQGYECVKLIPMDMFPQTYHFEVIGVFNR